MKRLVGSFRKDETGEIMLESTIILVSVLILLMVLLSLCFMYYQQSVMNTIANELSTAVAKNYKYYTVAPDENEVTSDDVDDVKKYRLTLGTNSMKNAWNETIRQPAKDRLALSSFGINSKGMNASCEIHLTGIGRAYVKVTVKNNTEFFLSGVLKWAGVIEDEGFSAVSYAEITDLSAYTSLVNFANYLYGGLGPVSGVAKIYVNLKDIIEKLVN